MNTAVWCAFCVPGDAGGMPGLATLSRAKTQLPVFPPRQGGPVSFYHTGWGEKKPGEGPGARGVPLPVQGSV